MSASCPIRTLAAASRLRNGALTMNYHTPDGPLHRITEDRGQRLALRNIGLAHAQYLPP